MRRLLSSALLLTTVLVLLMLTLDAPLLQRARAAGPLPATQPGAAPAPAPLPKGPVLTGEDGQPIKGVRLAKADVTSVVQGTLAQTTMTLTFANDQPRVLGGELVFPLPDGATVTGYGLEINGTMVDGVAVEKERARIIYEKEIHKRIDPGLVEHVAGNAFRTRLYPVPPNGTRSIRVEYVATIDPGAFDAGGKAPRASMTLPIGWKDVVDNVTLRIEVHNASIAPILNGPGGDQAGLTTNRDGDGFVIAGTVPTAALGDGLQIVLPALPERSVSVEKRARTARTVEDLESGAKPADAAARRFDHFFVINDAPQATARKAAQLQNRHIGIVWDASLSRADTDHARELKLLSAVLEHLGKPTVDVTIVRNDAQTRENLSSLEAIDAVSKLAYDGATNLGDLVLPKTVDLYLLFTDGMGNLSTDLPKRIEAPVYAVCDDARANHALLRALCQESGGTYFNLRQATDEQVISAVGDSPFSFISADFKEGDIAELYPLLGTTVNGRFALSGKLLVPEAKVTVHYGYGKDITHSETFTIKADGAAEGSLLPRFWAQQKVAALSMFPDKNAEELAKVGRQFNLVTPNTSLLVLETVEQYVQYRVVPPPTRPDIYKEFIARIEQNKQQLEQTREQKLQQVAAMWNARVQWWESEHKYPADLKVNAVADAQAGGGGGGLFSAGGRDGSGPTTRPMNYFTPPVSTVNAPARTTPALQPAAPPPADVPPTARPEREADRLADFGVPQGAPRPGEEQGRSNAAGAAGPGQLATEGAQREMAERNKLNRARASSSDFRGETGLDLKNADQPQQQEAAAKDVRTAESRLGNDQLSGELRSRSHEWGRIGGKGNLVAQQRDASVAIQAWDPNTPYIAAMKGVPADRAYDTFLEQRKTFGRSPAFYLDSADYLEHVGKHALAVRVLSDIAELQLQDARLLRVAAHRLLQIGERELAIDLFDKVLKLRPEEPQSARDLALALADRADSALASSASHDASQPIRDYLRSLELLNKVVEGHWDRFQEIELPVLMEANDIIAKLGRLPMAGELHIPIDPRLIKNLDCDVRVVMTWDVDQTDIDLWVTEPSGEKCFYGHNRTIIGGLLSRDFTDGYGPEEYCLRKQMPGTYNIQCNYYGSRQQELIGPATVQATVITNFGRPSEKRQALTVRLKDMKDVVNLGTITVGQKQQPTTKPAAPQGGPVLNK